MKVELIKKIVADEFRVRVSDIEGPSRQRKHTWPRHVAYLMVREFTDYSLPRIAELFGSRDHSTIGSGILRAVERIDRNDDDIAIRVDAIRQEIQNAIRPVMFCRHAGNPLIFRTTRKAA